MDVRMPKGNIRLVDLMQRDRDWLELIRGMAREVPSLPRTEGVFASD
jgi:hypothetical protein